MSSLGYKRLSFKRTERGGPGYRRSESRLHRESYGSRITRAGRARILSQAHAGNQAPLSVEVAALAG
jgi:hypothetical protein